jgi:hypothetical protein
MFDILETGRMLSSEASLTLIPPKSPLMADLLATAAGQAGKRTVPVT